MHAAEQLRRLPVANQLPTRRPSKLLTRRPGCAEQYTTRRDFLLLAGMTGVGASLIRPLNLFADAPASSPKSILVPANGHAAIQSAAILAVRLKLAESAISTYEGAPKATAGAIVLALASEGLPAAEVPRQDGYTVTYTGGTVVWGRGLGRFCLRRVSRSTGWRAALLPTGGIRSLRCAMRRGTRITRSPSRRRSSGQTFISRTWLLHRHFRRCPMSSRS